jgi:hypothetical protein
MPLKAWNHVLFFDPQIGEDSIRYQGFSGHGTYWIAEPIAPMGQKRRDQKQRCLDLIEAAIEMDVEAIRQGGSPTPGEVTITEVPAHLRKEDDAWLTS